MPSANATLVTAMRRAPDTPDEADTAVVAIGRAGHSREMTDGPPAEHGAEDDQAIGDEGTHGSPGRVRHRLVARGLRSLKGHRPSASGSLMPRPRPAASVYPRPTGAMRAGMARRIVPESRRRGAAWPLRSSAACLRWQGDVFRIAALVVDDSLRRHHAPPMSCSESSRTALTSLAPASAIGNASLPVPGTSPAHHPTLRRSHIVATDSSLW